MEAGDEAGLGGVDVADAGHQVLVQQGLLDGAPGAPQGFLDRDTALIVQRDAVGAHVRSFGLQAGVFTRDIGNGLKAAETLEFGGILVNEVPTFRADQQPYGGVKDSGNTREGPAYSVIELTEERMVTFQGG